MYVHWAILAAPINGTGNKRSARQTYRPDSVNPFAWVGNHSSGHFIAEML